jgi:uncharacterized membrane protein
MGYMQGEVRIPNNVMCTSRLFCEPVNSRAIWDWIYKIPVLNLYSTIIDLEDIMQPGFPQLLKLYAISVPVFFLIDLLWLGLIAKPFYDRHLGYILRGQVLWWAAIVFYLFFLLGLVVFVIAPAVESGSLSKAIFLGLFFGFITYQTYELTNYALVRDWPFIVVVVDIAWGMVLSSLVSTITFLVATKLFHSQ